jgi:hypothetical protein
MSAREIRHENVNILRITESPLEGDEFSRQGVKRWHIPKEHLADETVLIHGLLVLALRRFSPHL